MKKTLGIIKPDAVKKNVIGPILTMIEEAGFQITEIRMLILSKDEAREFYAVHKERPFFEDLVSYMTSGKIVAFALQRDSDDAVKDFRDLIGATDPAEAKDGTIRNRFGTSKEFNAIHGSDSPENADKEISFFFHK